MEKIILICLVCIFSFSSFAEKKIELKDLGEINAEAIKQIEPQEKPIGTLTQPKIQFNCTDKSGKLLTTNDSEYKECLNNIKNSGNKKDQSKSESTGSFNIKIGD